MLIPLLSFTFELLLSILKYIFAKKITIDN